MNIIYLTPKVNNVSTAVAIGKFDSIHLGHIRLIKKASEYAKEHKLSSVVYTVKQKSDTLVSANEDERTKIIKLLGADMLCTDILDEEYSRQTPREFVENVLIKKLNAKYVLVGYNFKFGYRRQGDAVLLAELCKSYGIVCKVIDCVCDEEENIPISTTYIKELISGGKVDKVKNFLGRHYSLPGVVCHGKHLGREIGFPTANLCCLEGSIIPANGVYLTKIKGDMGEYYGITNIGTNPTVSSDKNIKVETHIIDFTGDLYEKNLTIVFLKRIRDEKNFLSVENLKNQLEKDLICAKELIKRY